MFKLRILEIEQLICIADANNTAFVNAAPFKYVHIDNFFSIDIKI